MRRGGVQVVRGAETSGKRSWMLGKEGYTEWGLRPKFGVSEGPVARRRWIWIRVRVGTWEESWVGKLPRVRRGDGGTTVPEGTVSLSPRFRVH
jgi:hypothetical protein